MFVLSALGQEMLKKQYDLYYIFTKIFILMGFWFYVKD